VTEPLRVPQSMMFAPTQAMAAVAPTQAMSALAPPAVIVQPQSPPVAQFAAARAPASSPRSEPTRIRAREALERHSARDFSRAAILLVGVALGALVIFLLSMSLRTRLASALLPARPAPSAQAAPALPPNVTIVTQAAQPAAAAPAAPTTGAPAGPTPVATTVLTKAAPTAGSGHKTHARDRARDDNDDDADDSDGDDRGSHRRHRRHASAPPAGETSETPGQALFVDPKVFQGFNKAFSTE
jgi:hypothetical protein